MSDSDSKWASTPAKSERECLVNTGLRMVGAWPMRAATVWIVAAGMLTACSKKEEATSAPALPKTETLSLSKELFATELGVPGELISYQQVDLYARETSFVKKLFVDVGSEVKEGDLLISLEAPEINSRLSGAESRYKSQE